MTRAPTKSFCLVAFDAFSGPSLGDTWTWDGYSWTQRTPTHAPPARDGEVMAFDQQSRQLLTLGGEEIGNGCLTDTWARSGSDWIQLHPPTSPPNRFSAASAYDPVTATFQVTDSTHPAMRARRTMRLAVRTLRS
jgi:hypothetical protein